MADQGLRLNITGDTAQPKKEKAQEPLNTLVYIGAILQNSSLIDKVATFVSTPLVGVATAISTSSIIDECHQQSSQIMCNTVQRMAGIVILEWIFFDLF